MRNSEQIPIQTSWCCWFWISKKTCFSARQPLPSKRGIPFWLQQNWNKFGWALARFGEEKFYFFNVKRWRLIRAESKNVNFKVKIFEVYFMGGVNSRDFLSDYIWDKLSTIIYSVWKKRVNIALHALSIRFQLQARYRGSMS